MFATSQAGITAGSSINGRPVLRLLRRERERERDGFLAFLRQSCESGPGCVLYATVVVSPPSMNPSQRAPFHSVPSCNHAPLYLTLCRTPDEGDGDNTTDRQ
uniref:Uncharacterized protein n=1 Tax=Plectus sambesii TaxID=2011161 RepID=A0A914WN42_9BILA